MVVVEIEVPTNPNCEGTEYQVFQEVADARPIERMRLIVNGKEKLCWVTGLDENGKVCPAYAQRVADSGGGISFLIFGGKWGIRFKPDEFRDEPWDLNNQHQWGEPFKFYGDEGDIIYA